MNLQSQVSNYESKIRKYELSKSKSESNNNHKELKLLKQKHKLQIEGLTHDCNMKDREIHRQK